MKNPSKTAQTSTHSPKTISRRKLAIIIVGIMVFLFSIKVISDTTGVSMTPEQKKMQTYLEEKYGEEFVVEKPSLNGTGLGVKGIWEATAYPTSSPDKEFHISLSNASHKFKDQYVARTWSDSETKKIQPIVNNIFANTSTTIKARISTQGQLEEEATLTSPLYNEAKKLYPHLIHYEIQVISTNNSNSLDAIAQELYNIATYIKSNGIKNVSVLYAEVNESDKMIGRSCEITDSTTVTSIKECISDKVIIEKERLL